MATKKKAGAQLPLAPSPGAPRRPPAGGASIDGDDLLRRANAGDPRALAKLEPPAAPKTPTGRLTVARLTVHGVLGVEDSTIDLADITVLAGANATGKSTHLKALRSALGIDRTALARLARIDDSVVDSDGKEPSVEVLLVGEDREVQVTRRGAGSPEVRERVGEDWRKVPRPVEWLRDLIDVEAANPAAWLAADDETRATAVLAAMPLAGYDRAAALKAAGLETFRLPPLPAGLHPLEDLEQIEAAVFSSRTEVNRQERAEHDAATKLLAGLPAEAPGDVEKDVRMAEFDNAALADAIAREEEAADAAEREAAQAAAGALRVAQERIGGAFKAEAARLRAAHEAAAAELRAAAERRIAELLAETETAIDALKTRGEGEIDAAQEAAEKARQAAREKRENARFALDAKKRTLAEGREKLAALRAQQQTAETDRHVRSTAAEAQAKAREHAARAAALTAGIEALKRYRLQLAERLPIKGLRIAFDEKGRKSLLLDNVPLGQVNDGRLVELATEVSLLRSRPADPARPHLPLVLLDGMEKLDPKARAALLREIASRGAQVVAAVVGPEALRTLRGEAAVA
jgi:hypothetical protein